MVPFDLEKFRPLIQKTRMYGLYLWFNTSIPLYGNNETEDMSLIADAVFYDILEPVVYGQATLHPYLQYQFTYLFLENYGNIVDEYHMVYINQSLPIDL